MATFAGETVVWKTSATAPDDAETVLTDGDVTQVLITIHDTSDDSALVTDSAMTWNATDQEWRYVWATPGTAGTFRGKMRIVGASFNIWEVAKVRTKTTPNSL